MSGTTSAADAGRIAAELRNWARGCHSTEAAVELLIRARGGRYVDPSQPCLRTDDRGIVWLDRTGHTAVLTCSLLTRAPHSGTHRGPRTRWAARRCGRPHGQLGPLPSWSRSCGLAACRHWQRADTQFNSSSTSGIGRSSERVVLIALGPMRATRPGIDSRSVGAPACSVDG